jgi:hypothetical protein
MPALASVSRDYFEGNLWIQELVVGDPLRFAVGDGGYVRFADADGTVSDPAPLGRRAAVTHVRMHLDVDRLRMEADTPERYTFFGVATHGGVLPYDLDRLPPFVGFDVWDDARGCWLPADTVVRVLEGLGLDPVNAFERELPARHFYPDRWETPDSAWYDGPPAGIVVRDKHGNRARRYHEGFDPSTAERDRHPDPEALAEDTVTAARLERAAERVRATGRSPTFDTLYDAVAGEVFREAGVVATADDEQAFRSGASERIQRWLDD